MLGWFIDCFRLSRWFSFHFSHSDDIHIAKMFSLCSSSLWNFAQWRVNSFGFVMLLHKDFADYDVWRSWRIFYGELDVSTECLSRHERSELVRMSKNLILLNSMRTKRKKKVQISFLIVFVGVKKKLPEISQLLRHKFQSWFSETFKPLACTHKRSVHCCFVVAPHSTQ